MTDSNNLMARLAEPAMQAMIKTYMQKFDDIQTLLKTIFKNQALWCSLIVAESVLLFRSGYGRL